MTDRQRGTLRYCVILYFFIVPVYFGCYRLLYGDIPWRTALINSALFGVVNVLFLGAVHYYRVGRRAEGDEE